MIDENILNNLERFFVLKSRLKELLGNLYPLSCYLYKKVSEPFRDKNYKKLVEEIKKHKELKTYVVKDLLPSESLIGCSLLFSIASVINYIETLREHGHKNKDDLLLMANVVASIFSETIVESVKNYLEGKGSKDTQNLSVV